MKAAEAAVVMKMGRTMMAADKVAESIEPDTVMVIEKALEAKVAKYGLDKFGKSWTPAEALTRLKEKNIAGAPVEELLDQRAEMLLFESRRNSLKFVASGLRNWHGFAVFILNQVRPEENFATAVSAGRCQVDHNSSEPWKGS